VTRRHPRDGIRDRWVAAIAEAKIGTAVKMLLLYLVATERVSDRGAVTFQREAVANELRMHPQRVSIHIRLAREAGLLDRRGGGWRGRTSEYVVTIPLASASRP
jgi:hypothetical protein